MPEPLSLESLEGVRCYGQPEDCRGWRQFLVEREACLTATNPPPPDGQLPAVVWVRLEPDKAPCGHTGYVVLPESVQEFVREFGLPTFAGRHVACEKQGRFIE